MSMKQKSLWRLEWVSLVYLALFALAVLSPSLVERDMFGIDEKTVEEAFIFGFGLVGLATFGTYQRYMEKREREHEDAVNAYERAKRELVESYKYIGSINRKIEVLKGVANKTSLEVVGNMQYPKELLSSLVANAAVCVGAQRALLRYLELARVRTEHEVIHAPNGNNVIRVSNKELKKLHDSGAAHAFLRSEEGKEILVIPSDHKEKAVKAFLLIEVEADQTMDVLDTSLLKVFANQAELLQRAREDQMKVDHDPMRLVEEAQRAVVGEIS